jgi:hypothetical protein
MSSYEQTEFNGKPSYNFHKSDDCSDEFPMRFMDEKASRIVDNLEEFLADFKANQKSATKKSTKKTSSKKKAKKSEDDE